jgi:hypothetical protein
MPMHEHSHPDHEPQKIDTSLGYEASDANVAGIAVFLISLFILVGVTGILCYGIGAMFNAHMNKEDGPNTKWTKTADVRQLGNLPSSPELQNKVAELTQSFPTPRLLIDDGDEDVAQLHARENLLLDNYTWVDQSKGTVRIPIDRAMELLAQRGLPAAKAVQTAPPMMGDNVPTVTAPLTDGFAPTAYEQAKEEEEAVRARQAAEK